MRLQFKHHVGSGVDCFLIALLGGSDYDNAVTLASGLFRVSGRCQRSWKPPKVPGALPTFEVYMPSRIDPSTRTVAIDWSARQDNLR